MKRRYLYSPYHQQETVALLKNIGPYNGIALENTKLIDDEDARGQREITADSIHKRVKDGIHFKPKGGFIDGHPYSIEYTHSTTKDPLYVPFTVTYSKWKSYTYRNSIKKAKNEGLTPDRVPPSGPTLPKKQETPDPVIKKRNIFAFLAARLCRSYNYLQINHKYTWKIVMRWESRCNIDLDLHAVLDNGQRIYYANKGNSNIWLNYDFRTHSERNDRLKKPEIITILGIPASTATIEVRNYSGGHLKRPVTIEVFRKNRKKDKLASRYTYQPIELSGPPDTRVQVCTIDLINKKLL